MNVTDEMLVAFADGELDPKGREAVMRAVAADPQLRERLAAHQRLRETLTAHFAPVAAEPVPDRLKTLLAGNEDEKDNVVDLAAVRAVRKRRAEQGEQRRRFPPWGNIAAIAATLVLGLAIGRSMNEESPVGLSGNGIYARGELAETLDTRLASVQTAGADTRIGLTFRNERGEICRTFEGTAMSGLACRGDGRWRLEQVLPGSAAGADYRQASGSDPRLADNVATMIEGEPLDAVAERAARERGWR